MTEEVIHAKRIKLDTDETNVSNERCEADESTKWKIKAILSDEYYEPLKRCFAYAGVLNDTKLIGKVMNEIYQRMPLNELNHLKRVNKTKLLLCSMNEMLQFLCENHENESIQAMLPLINTTADGQLATEDDLRVAKDEVTISLAKLYMTSKEISTEVIAVLTEKVEIAAVSAEAPVLSWQYADVAKDWPCKFHPNKDLEKMYNGKWFTDTDTAFHTKIMEICGFLCKELKKQVSGIAVDPRTKSIVAIGFDECDRHPLMHCTMVLIDGVARSQNGGAWNEYLVNTELYSNDESAEYTQYGVSSYLRRLITSKFPAIDGGRSITFGAERVRSDAESRQILDIDVNSDNLAKYGPYLCTGYDVYLWREPCVMCSMALTHSRIRTIFFHQTQSKGAIRSLTKLQSVKALNHHFQVFHITADS
ncbi:probable inactive tRNA-specific adenosine deaminase-like protein 3 [Sitodiplosis mosellana]|uniref:probable inactive tRNA-specific adenosine deaminase-like protein 3 n=1 Tax=Sitodiplosis mosellana TaxID=263140 RepID=UPI0024441E29|nr:probable inactive tRNA-specific adenosine deaminase-like protein 3 [Sitodiplosis mosellana]